MLFGQICSKRKLLTGLASSPTELPYSVESADAQRRPFDVVDVLRTPYRMDIHHTIYFVLENSDTLFSAAKRDLLVDIAQARKLGLHEPAYQPIDQSA